VTKTHNVAFLSGDVHLAGLTRMDCGFLGFPLYDLTSSGMTHAWNGLKQFIIRATISGYRLVAPRWTDLNSGEVSIDFAQGTVGFRIFEQTGQTVIKHVVPLVNLQPPSDMSLNSTTQDMLLACVRAEVGSASWASTCQAVVSSCLPKRQFWDVFYFCQGVAMVICFASTVIYGVVAAFQALLKRKAQGRGYQIQLFLLTTAVLGLLPNLRAF